jgi:hypothetical protein
MALVGSVLVASLWTSGAAASQEYPSALEESLNMPCVPQCTVCHATELGGAGTSIQPFATSVKQAGALGANVDSLLTALATLQAAGKDTDGDMNPDIDELAAGEDPNEAGAARICGPVYGCGAHVSRTPPSRNGAAWAFAGCAAALVAFGFRRVSSTRPRT